MPCFCQACGRLADIGGAVAALQQQQQALLLVAGETAKLREEMAQRTRADSAKWVSARLELIFSVAGCKPCSKLPLFFRSTVFQLNVAFIDLTKKHLREVSARASCPTTFRTFCYTVSYSKKALK